MSGPPTPSSTALVVLIPDADRVVGRWRDELDPSAKRGLAAHITVLYPWIPLEDLTDADEQALADLVAKVRAFNVSLNDIQRFPRTLWLAPYPADPFIRLTMDVHKQWPEFEPYGGRFSTIVPHLSIGDAVDPDALGHVVADVAPRLPIESRITEVAHMVHDSNGQWQQRSVYPLG